MKIHMVKKGDTLYEIAQKHNVDLEKLIASNPQIVNSDAIEVGMKVKIPNEPKSLVPPTDYIYKHKVAQGDTLWKLSKAWNVSLQAVIAANPQLKNPNILMTGEIVYIPKITSQQQPQHPVSAYQSSKPSTAPLTAEPLTGAAETMPPMPIPTPAATPMSTPIPEMGYTQPNMPPMPMVMPTPEATPMSTPIPEMGYGQSYKPEKDIEQTPLPNMPQQSMEHLPAYPSLQPAADSYSEMQMYMNEQQSTIHPFQQFQQPAAEVFTMDYPNVPQPPVWTQPELPETTAMPYMDQAHYQSYGTEQPAYPMPPQYPAMAHDCGCGGPTMQSYDHAIPYPYATSPSAAEMFTGDHPNVPQPPVWTQPELPETTAMPYMDQAHYQSYGTEQPAYPMHPQYPAMAHDCGCGGPTMQSYDHAIPYPYATSPSTAEMFTGDHPYAPQPPVWTQPELPETTAMPYMDQAHYQSYGTAQPTYPMPPQYPVMAHDCGCGGPAMQYYDHAMPYPYATSAYPSNPFVTNPYVNVAPHHPMDQMMHPAYMQSFQPVPVYWPSPAEALPMQDMNAYGYTPCYEPMAMTSAYPGGGFPIAGYPHTQYPSAAEHGFPYGQEQPDYGSHDKEDAAQPTREKIKFEPVATVSKKEEKAIVKSSDRKPAASANKAAKSSAQRNRRTKRGSTKGVVNSPWLGR